MGNGCRTKICPGNGVCCQPPGRSKVTYLSYGVGIFLINYVLGVGASLSGLSRGGAKSGPPDTFWNSPDEQAARLPNAAVRMVTKTKKHNLITLVSRQLRWLPVQQRMVFKILMLTYRALNCMVPAYISSLLELPTALRSLRSAEDTLRLVVSRSKSSTKELKLLASTYGDRAFSVAANAV